MVVSGSILKRFKIILKRSMKSFVMNSLDFVKSKFLSSLIFFRLFMTSDWSVMPDQSGQCRTDISVYQVHPRYRSKPLPQMIHQTLSYQVIHGNGNRTERMPVKPLPCVLYTGIHEPIMILGPWSKKNQPDPYRSATMWFL